MRDDANARLRMRRTAGSLPRVDLDTWAFSDTPPWEVELARCTWRGDVDALRVRSRSVVPELVRPRAVPPVWRFTEASALIGAGLLAWVLRERRRGGSASRAGLSRRL